MLSVAPIAVAMDEVVKISTQDGIEFILDLDLAKLSVTLKDVILDSGAEEVIPLSNVTIETWTFIHKQLKNIQDDRNEGIEEALSELNGDQLVAVINAANYLDIKILLDETLKFARKALIDPTQKITPKQASKITEKFIRNSLLLEIAQEVFGPLSVEKVREFQIPCDEIDFGEIDPYRFIILPDDNFVIAAGENIGILDSETGKLLKTWKIPKYLKDTRIISLKVLVDSKIASVTSHGTIHIWNWETEELLQTLNAGRSESDTLVVLPNGNIASWSSSSLKIQVWDIKTGKKLNQFSSASKWAIALPSRFTKTYSVIALPNGNIASWDARRGLDIWDTKKGERLATYKRPKETNISYSGSGGIVPRIYSIESMISFSNGNIAIISK